MQPKRIPTYVLVAIWFLGLTPYLVVEFWPWEPVFHYAGNGKIGKITSDCSMKFFTAFPFWFVIQWFQKRDSRNKVAKNQLRFLDRAIDMLNQVVEFSLEEASKIRSISPDYFHQRVWLERIKEFRESQDKSMRRIVREAMPMILYSGHKKQLQQQYEMILPYAGAFSTDFTNALTSAVAEFLDEGKYWDKSKPEWDNVVSIYQRFHENLETLESWYVRDNKLPEDLIAPRLRRWPYMGSKPSL